MDRARALLERIETRYEQNRGRLREQHASAQSVARLEQMLTDFLDKFDRLGMETLQDMGTKIDEDWGGQIATKPPDEDKIPRDAARKLRLKERNVENRKRDQIEAVLQMMKSEPTRFVDASTPGS